MGIKYFFSWVRKTHGHSITNIKNYKDTRNIPSIDNLLLDINGIIHTCCQKVFKYGSYAPNKIIGKTVTLNKDDIRIKSNEAYGMISDTIDKVLKMIDPCVRLVICIDGPAPLAKQNQQRQRRFRASIDSTGFDSACISPGTIFMSNLSIYLDRYITNKISRGEWKDIEVIFSGDKYPGEGEHKIMSWIRSYNTPNVNESFCIYANDADLIMLALSTHIKNFYLLRDSLYDNYNTFYIVNINKIRSGIIQEMSWVSSNNKSIINDFIFICFLVGNDFLPNIPSLEILERGIDIMFTIYKEVCTKLGHLTVNTNKGLYFKRKPLAVFLELFSSYEKQILENKYSNTTFYKDDILEDNIKLIDNKHVLDIKKYKDDYYKKKFNSVDISKVCDQYLEGLEWTFTYYTKGVPSWQWFYNHNYAPFASDLSEHLKLYEHKHFKTGVPTKPYLQLLIILPKSSIHLLPSKFKNTDDLLKKYYPDKLTVDLSGKRKEWEGIPILPPINIEDFESVYNTVLTSLTPEEQDRNKLTPTYKYKRGSSRIEIFI